MQLFNQYILNILIWLDQGLNTLTGGDPDETVSSRLGKLKENNAGRIPWSRPLSKIIDYGLDKIDKNHSIDAIEHDEGKDAVLDREVK